jgi:hypothetical protein
MSSQYNIKFSTLEKLWAFKLSIQPEAYVIDVARKTIQCFCSELEMENAVNNYEGSLATTVKFASIL